MLCPLEAPAAPFALTTDELRAIARVTGAPLSGLLLDGEDEADAPLADAIALRGLAARGLVTIAGEPTEPGAIRLSPGTRSMLGPVLAPEALVEVEADRQGASYLERHVVCAAGPRTLVLSEADEADVWRVLKGGVDLAATLASVVELPEAATDDATDPARHLRVPAAVHAAADEALEEGGDAVAELVAGGADTGAAAAWVAAVTGRRCSVALRAARLLPGDVIEAAELRILSAGSLGTWIIDLHEDGNGNGDGMRDGIGDATPGDGWAGCSSVMTDVGSRAASAAVASLLPMPSRPAAD